jgi:hypothetical protein
MAAVTERWKRLRSNAGMWGVVRAILTVALIAGVAIATPIVSPPHWVFVPAAIAGLALPYFLRDALVEHVNGVLPVHRYSGMVILIGAGFFRDQLVLGHPILPTLVLLSLAIYISIYFWLLSDERIVIENR